MNIKDCVHLKTKTISTGEYLPLETNVIVNVPEYYVNTPSYVYHTFINRCLNTAIRILEYNGYTNGGYTKLGTAEISNSSRIKAKAKPSGITAPDAVIINVKVTFTKIADDASFTVVPRDNTIFEVTGTFDNIDSSLEIAFSDQIRNYLKNIYTYPENSTEYYNLYGKLQLTNFVATIIKDNDYVAPTNE